MRSTRSARVVTRLATLDVPGMLSPFLPKAVSHILVSLFCIGLMMDARVGIDAWITPGGGTYSVGFPVVLIAVLFAGWVSGVLTTLMIVAYAWFVVLPKHRLGLSMEDHFHRLMITLVCLLAVVVLAGMFRRAAQIAIAARDRQIADMDLFLSEFDHRTKNNFASVAALLELQAKRAPDEAAAEALNEARARVESMARAHLHLYRDGGSVGTVNARDYLSGLCEALGDGIFLREGVSLHWEVEPVPLDRDRAITVGLITNELVTNAAKHAFSGREGGRIDVRFARHDDRLVLSVADDGVGSESFTRKGGLGARLIDAFVRQLNGQIKRDSGAEGSRFVIDMPA